MGDVETAFLDRDGTLNRKAPEGDYVKRPEELELLPGVPAAVERLAEAGLRLIVVTNQRGIARGLMTEQDLDAIHARLRAQLPAIDAIYHCPHEEGECDCRKPAIGMFERARRDFPEIDFARSVVIGDSWRDMEAGRAIGARCIEVGSLADAVAALCG